MKFLNVVFTIMALAFLLTVQPHHAAARVLEGEQKEYLIEKRLLSLLENPQHMGPVPPSSPNSCEKIPINGLPCKTPPASPPK